MITISLMGQLQTLEGERDLACEVPSPMSVRQVIQRQGIQLRHLLQLIREKKVLVTIHKKIASDQAGGARRHGRNRAWPIDVTRPHKYRAGAPLGEPALWFFMRRA